MPRASENGLERPHSEIVVILRGELFAAKTQASDDFYAELPGLLKAHGIEEDFGDHGVVRHHHGAGAEEHLEVVREVTSAGVARVHGYVDPAGGDERNFVAFEIEFDFLLLDGSLYGKDLLGDDREHFCVNSVELIETAPGA